MADKTYLAIDLKSFYASVECVERGLDPLTTNLVVADLSRTEKTICLAVTPALKAYGISGRARLFEVVERVKQVNAERLRKAPDRTFAGSSTNDPELKAHPELALDYLHNVALSRRRTLVLSDIAQSGLSDDELYGRVAGMVARAGIDTFIGIGPKLKRYASLFACEREFFASTGECIARIGRDAVAGRAVLLREGNALWIQCAMAKI